MDYNTPASERTEPASMDANRQSGLTPIAILLHRMIAAGRLPFMPADEGGEK